jgi:inner membrane protein
LPRAVGGLARLPLRLFVVLPHRGPTHSLLGCVIAAGLTALVASHLAPSVAVAGAAGIAVGSLAHILGDACTPGGVPLTWPLSRRRHWLLPAPARIPTGSVRECALAALLTAALSAALILLSGG